MARKSGFIRRHGKMVRETAWFGGIFSQVSLSGANAVSLATTLNAAALAMRPFTLIRTRGIVTVRSDQRAATENYAVAFGRTVVTDQAVAIGVTAVPTPITDSDSDLWFVYEVLAGQISVGTDIGVFESGAMGLNRQFDSKAMRKVEPGQDVVSVIENNFSAGTITTIFSRSLIKLH